MTGNSTDTRLSSGDSTEEPDPARGKARHGPSDRYTLHLDFAAVDVASARRLAVDLAEGLGLLRPDVETYSAMLSADGRWGDPRPVFCLAIGPGGAFCADLAGHPGWHVEAGINGVRWAHA